MKEKIKFKDLNRPLQFLACWVITDIIFLIGLFVYGFLQGLGLI